MNFLKIFGMLTMLADHVGFLFDIQVLRYVGRACFPVFAFMTAYGWAKSKNRTEYLRRMMELAVCSELPFLWMYQLSGDVSVSQANSQFALICSGISLCLLLWAAFLIKRSRPVRLQNGSIWADACLAGLYFLLPVLIPHTNVLYTLTTALLIFQVFGSALNIMVKVIAGSGLILGYGIFCDYSIFGLALIIGIYYTMPACKALVFGTQIRKLAAVIFNYIPYVFMLLWVAVMTIFYQDIAELVGMCVGVAVVFGYMELSKQKPAAPVVRKLNYYFYPVHLLVLDITAFLILR